MNTLKQNIDIAFSQTVSVLSEKFKRKHKDSALYLQFLERESKLFFYSKGHKPAPICFTQMMSSKMIGLGLTVEKVYMAMQWLKTICQKEIKIERIEQLSFLLFSTENLKQALVGVCIEGKHIISYHLSDVLEQFDSKQEHLPLRVYQTQANVASRSI